MWYHQCSYNRRLCDTVEMISLRSVCVCDNEGSEWVVIGGGIIMVHVYQKNEGISWDTQETDAKKRKCVTVRV